MNRPPKRPSAEELQRECDRFNARHPIGSDVMRFRLSKFGGDGRRTKTRSEAWVMGGHSAMVLVERFSGGQSLDAIGPVEPNDHAPDVGADIQPRHS